MNKFVERKNIDIYLPVLKNTVEKEKITVIPELNNINISEIKGIIEEKINLINKENGEYNNSININLFDGFYSLENSEKIEVLKTIKELKEKEKQKALETKVNDFEIKVNLQYPFEEIYELYKKDKKNNIKKGELYNFIKMISEFKVDSIILDIYSTIGYINRVNGLNYDYDDIKNVVKEIRKIRLFKKSEVIISTYIGLLESEINEDKENIQKIASLNIKTIVLSPVIILKGTEISKKFIKEEYKYLSNNELKTHITNIAVMLNEIGVKTYINHDLSRYNDDDYIAGPYVKNINRIVQTEVWYEKLLHMIKDLNVRVKKIEVIVKEKEIPKIIGEEKENIKRLKELYDIYLEFKKFENLVGWDRFITKFKMKHNKCDISIRILEKYEDKYKDGK